LVYRGDIDGGIREFQRERAINPNYAMVHCNLGGAYSRKDRERAIPFLERGCVAES
jgi:hypothetical protein